MAHSQGREIEGTALAALAERLCIGAGTTLATVLDDLTTGTPHPDTPPALRAGWNLPTEKR